MCCAGRSVFGIGARRTEKYHLKHNLEQSVSSGVEFVCKIMLPGWRVIFRAKEKSLRSTQISQHFLELTPLILISKSLFFLFCIVFHMI